MNAARNTNAARLASAIEALANCERAPRNEYGATLHRATVDRIMRNAPHGSGIDDAVTLHDASHALRLVFFVPFHRMNAHGYYDGWQTFRVVARPTFGGIDVAVTGRGDEGTKDWLADVFRDWAESLAPEEN